MHDWHEMNESDEVGPRHGRTANWLAHWNAAKAREDCSAILWGGAVHLNAGAFEEV